MFKCSVFVIAVFLALGLASCCTVNVNSPQGAGDSDEGGGDSNGADHQCDIKVAIPNNNQQGDVGTFELLEAFGDPPVWMVVGYLNVQQVANPTPPAVDYLEWWAFKKSAAGDPPFVRPGSPGNAAVDLRFNQTNPMPFTNMTLFKQNHVRPQWGTNYEFWESRHVEGAP